MNTITREYNSLSYCVLNKNIPKDHDIVGFEVDKETFGIYEINFLIGGQPIAKFTNVNWSYMHDFQLLTSVLGYVVVTVHMKTAKRIQVIPFTVKTKRLHLDGLDVGSHGITIYNGICYYNGTCAVPFYALFRSHELMEMNWVYKRRMGRYEINEFKKLDDKNARIHYLLKNLVRYITNYYYRKYNPRHPYGKQKLLEFLLSSKFYLL